MDSFIDFKKKIDTDDPEAWKKLKLNVSNVVNHWCREKYLEVSWIVLNEKLIENQDFYNAVYSYLYDNYKFYKDNIKEYSDLKNIIVDIANKIQKKGFMGFFVKIYQNDDHAWKILDCKLKILIKSWLIRKGDTSESSFQTIFDDSLSLFIEILKKGRLEFNDSKKLKSYFLKIAENKRKEYYRLNNSNKCIPLGNHTSEPLYEINLPIEEQQIKKQLRLKLNQLNNNEKTIIYGVYFYKMMLKDLAVMLDISEEACRVTKLRAIRKLQGLYSQVTL